MRKVGHVKWTEERRKAQKVSSENLKEGDHSENQRRWEENIRMKVI